MSTDSPDLGSQPQKISTAGSFRSILYRPGQPAGPDLQLFHFARHHARMEAISQLALLKHQSHFQSSLLARQSLQRIRFRFGFNVVDAIPRGTNPVQGPPVSCGP